jgi:hypothetical protein
MVPGPFQYHHFGEFGLKSLLSVNTALGCLDIFHHSLMVQIPMFQAELRQLRRVIGRILYLQKNYLRIYDSEILKRVTMS